jgi:hypothetical protein
MLRWLEALRGDRQTLRRRSTSAVHVGVVAALLALVSTAGAFAAVPGYQKVDTALPYPNTSVSPKSVDAKCPPGKRVLGAGGKVSYGSPGLSPFGKIVLNRLIPNVALGRELEGGSVGAFEHPQGTALNWACAPRRSARIRCPVWSSCWSSRRTARLTSGSRGSPIRRQNVRRATGWWAPAR